MDISICQDKSDHFPTDGYQGKPAYFYSGTKDKIVPHEFTKSSAEWHKEMGVDLKTNWIDEFEHVYPNDIPGHLYNNPQNSCESNFLTPLYGGLNNCDYDLAKDYLEFILG